MELRQVDAKSELWFVQNQNPRTDCTKTIWGESSISNVVKVHTQEV